MNNLLSLMHNHANKSLLLNCELILIKRHLKSAGPIEPDVIWAHVEKAQEKLKQLNAIIDAYYTANKTTDAR